MWQVTTHSSEVTVFLTTNQRLYVYVFGNKYLYDCTQIPISLTGGKCVSACVDLEINIFMTDDQTETDESFYSWLQWILRHISLL